MIAPSMTYAEILQSFKRTLGLVDPNESIFVSDINGELICDPEIAKFTPFIFQNVNDGERLLVGTYEGAYEGKCINAEPELEGVLHLEYDTGELDGPLRVSYILL
jgi:hypothetical protein